jgi:hypothetical protein
MPLSIDANSNSIRDRDKFLILHHPQPQRLHMQTQMRIQIRMCKLDLFRMLKSSVATEDGIICQSDHLLLQQKMVRLTDYASLPAYIALSALPSNKTDSFQCPLCLRERRRLWQWVHLNQSASSYRHTIPFNGFKHRVAAVQKRNSMHRMTSLQYLQKMKEWCTSKHQLNLHHSSRDIIYTLCGLLGASRSLTSTPSPARL